MFVICHTRSPVLGLCYIQASLSKVFWTLLVYSVLVLLCIFTEDSEKNCIVATIEER